MTLSLCLLLWSCSCHGEEFQHTDDDGHIPDDDYLNEITDIQREKGDMCTQPDLSEDFTRENCQDFWRSQLRIYLAFEGIPV